MPPPQLRPQPKPRLLVPGLEGRPDLQRRLEYELARSPGCTGCQRAALIRKYKQLAR